MGLAAVCLKTYVNPFKDPNFDEDDPRWIGAWWLGPTIIAMLIFGAAMIITLFPQRLPILDSGYRFETDVNGRD